MVRRRCALVDYLDGATRDAIIESARGRKPIAALTAIEEHKSILLDAFRTVSGHCQFEVRQTSTSRAVGGRFADARRPKRSPVGEILWFVVCSSD